VTHHVELVLPGAHYLVRMLDGRIDTQGTIADLRDQGVLDDITHAESADAQGKEVEPVAETVAEDVEPGAIVADAKDVKKATDATKKPRKLVKEEKREEGGVKWSIYKTYLKAS
jgi:hypothetical protein